MLHLFKLVSRMLVPAILGTFLFVGGYYLGTTRANSPETFDGPVSGIYNLENNFVSTSGIPTRSENSPTCTDERGANVPCLLGRITVEQKVDIDADFSQFWRAWNIISEKYVPTKHAQVSNQEKVWGAISGLANSLGDPYTYFLPPQEKVLFEQEVTGKFGGVGMQIGMKDGLVTVIAPLKDSPAERAGILKGDKVIIIDGATTTEMTLDKALYLIRGEVGKVVHLSLLRDGVDKLIDVSITREEIKVPTVETEKKDGVFIIRYFGFPATGAELFRNALEEFAQSGTDKLVLDLRGNPGGYLEVAVDIASWFLPEGKVIVSEAEKDGTGDVYRSRGHSGIPPGFTFVILIDGGSASASEILAGALQQHGVVKLVGTKTFGKGSVQELIPITETTSLKITIARWITPNGTNLSEGGIEPDFVVELTKEQVDKGEDPQLEKAIEVAKQPQQ